MCVFVSVVFFSSKEQFIRRNDSKYNRDKWLFLLAILCWIHVRNQVLRHIKTYPTDVAIVVEIFIIMFELLGVHLITSIDKWHSNQMAFKKILLRMTDSRTENIGNTFQMNFWMQHVKNTVYYHCKFEVSQKLAWVKNGLLLELKLNKALFVVEIQTKKWR